MKIPLESALALLHESGHGTLATNALQMPGYPYATVVPYVLDDAHCPIIHISALAEHTRNLIADPRIALSVLQPGASDVHDAPRLTLIGDAAAFEPAPELLTRYLRHEPSAERLLALDFAFFRLVPQRIRYIGGVGRMGWLEGADWQPLPRLPLAEEARILAETGARPPHGIRLLGIDCFGIDFHAATGRKRQRFPNAPLPVEAIEKAMTQMAAGLS